jgi:PST family polysaccharide transporter
MTISDGKTVARLAVRNTTWVAFGAYFNIIIGFAGNLVLTRILSPEVFGVFSLANFWSGLISIRPHLGINYAAIQRQETDGKLLGTYFALNLVVTIISLILGGIAFWLLPEVGYSPVVAGATFVLVLTEGILALGGPLSLILEKELQLSRPILLAMVASIVAYIISIGLALAGAELWSLLTVTIISNLISLSGLYWIAKTRCPYIFDFQWQFNQNLAKQLLGKGVPTGLALLARTMVGQFDNFLIGTFIGYSTLGLYDRAFRIAHWSNLLLITVVTRIAFVTFARVSNDLPRLTHAVRLSLWLLLTLGLPITLTIFFGAEDIVYILYGSKWLECVYFLRFLVIYALAAPFVQLTIWLSTALGQGRTTIMFTTIQAVIMVGIATPLTLQFGVLGTMAGVGITEFLGFCFCCYYIFRQISLTFTEIFVAPLMGAGFASMVLLILSNLAFWQSMWPLGRLTLVGTISCVIFFLTLLVLRPQETITRLKYLQQTWRNP